MAGDWLKLEIATPDKPEVWIIAAELDIDPDAVFGKLFRVWCWFDQHTQQGNANSVSDPQKTNGASVTKTKKTNAGSVTKTLLDRVVSVTGFCDAMIDAGWMIESGGEISLPNFGRHNGKTAKTRATTAKRVANHKKKAEKTNADTVSELTPTPLPREEKRREENKDKDIGASAKASNGKTPSASDRKKTAAPKYDPMTAALPFEINPTAWAEWVQYRKQTRKPISELAAKKAWALLAGHDNATQAEIISQSIANDYQGLFEPKRQSALATRTTQEKINDTSWSDNLDL